MSEERFSEPRRQEPLGVIILFGENLRKMFRVVAALLFASIYSDIFYFGATVTISVLAVLMGIYTLFQYLRFRFHISDDQLILEKGVFHRERLSIPLGRIQTVHLSQNIVQQVTQLTGVKIDTAGSGKEELKISALTHSDAESLQRVLEKQQIKTTEEEVNAHRAEQEKEQDLLVHLDILKLLVVGLTQNHIRSGFVALGVVSGYYWQFEDVIREQMGVQLDMSPEDLEEAVAVAEWGITALAIFGIVFLVASVIVSLVRTVLRHFNLKASLSEKHVQVSSGLLKRNVYTIPLNKIQMMKWNGNFLRRIPGFESVMIRQSKSSGDERKLNVEIPACYSEQTERLENSLFGKELQSRLFSYSPHPFYRVLLSFIFAVVGLVVFLQMFAITKNPWVWIGYLPVLLIILAWVRKYVSTVRLTTNGDLVQFSKGWLFTERTLLKVYKIQSVQFTQSVFQKRRGTAHLKLYTAGGSLTMRFMPEQLVKELYNYLLYKVEVSDENWM